MWASALLIVVLIAGGGYFYYQNTYLVNKKVRLVENQIDVGNFDQAYEMYRQILEDGPKGQSGKIIEKINSDLASKVESKVNAYVDKSADYQSADEMIRKLVPFEPLTSALEKNRTRLDQFKKSRDAYEEAGKLHDNKDYNGAILKYKNVISEDAENYASAQENIKSSMQEYYDDSVSKSESLFQQQKYEEAYNQIKVLENYYANDQTYQSKQKQYLQALYDSKMAAANDLSSKKQYDQAISSLQAIEPYFPDDSVLKQKINEYGEAKTKEREARKKALLAQVTSNYDDMSGITAIVPKGYDSNYVNISGSINIEPRITITDLDSAAFNIIAGFKQDDWVFMDKIIFNVDGERFQWDIGFGDRESQVLWGGIAEWTVQRSFFNNDLLDQMQKVVNGKSVKMRFSGREGFRDHTVTAAEKANIKLFLELYGYYENLDHILDISGKSA